MKNPDTRSWRHLYRGAILETNQNDIPDQIAEARKATVCRVRYLLLSTESHLDEKEELEGRINGCDVRSAGAANELAA